MKVFEHEMIGMNTSLKNFVQLILASFKTFWTFKARFFEVENLACLTKLKIFKGLIGTLWEQGCDNEAGQKIRFQGFYKNFAFCGTISLSHDYLKFSNNISKRDFSIFQIISLHQFFFICTFVSNYQNNSCYMGVGTRIGRVYGVYVSVSHCRQRNDNEVQRIDQGQFLEGHCYG